MNREERLLRQFCKYLGFDVLRADGCVRIVFQDDSDVLRVSYDSSHDALFGQYSLQTVGRFFINRKPVCKRGNEPFRFSSLDELELQLSIRGF